MNLRFLLQGTLREFGGFHGMTARPGGKFASYVVLALLLHVAGSRLFVRNMGVEFGYAGVHGSALVVIVGIKLGHRKLLFNPLAG